MDFYEAYHYLDNHIIFQGNFTKCLYIEVVKVNPLTKEVDDDKTKNTLTNIWIECGPYKEQYETHDISLDCGGDTFEEAIIKLANLVKDSYGEDENALLEVEKRYPNISFDEY